jgi:hypothetical protein
MPVTVLSVSQVGNQAKLSWRVVDDPSGSPGSAVLIAGDMAAGYFGAVPSAEFITGDSLCSLIGLSAGTSQHSTTDWLKFAFEDKVLFVAKKPIRCGLSWDNINAANAVYGGRTVEIGGLTYKIRLIRGAATDPSQYSDTDRGAIGSEWNNLILPLHEKAPSSWAFPEYVDSPTDDWGEDFTDADLVTIYTAGNGYRTLCQETSNSNATERVCRGDNGAEYAFANPASYAGSVMGYRPVLEVV